MQEKRGEDEFGPYGVVANWPQPIPGTDGYTWGSTGGVFAETPDRVWIVQRGMLPLPAGAKFGVPLQGQATGAQGQKWQHCIFVVDRNGRMVQSWTQHDKIFAREGRARPAQDQDEPYDPQKHVWIMDDNLHQLFKFTYDGKLVQTWGEQLVRGEDQTPLRPPDRHRLAARRHVLRQRRLHEHARRQVLARRQIPDVVGHVERGQGQPGPE